MTGQVVSTFYGSMSDLEIIQHVISIPDASELSSELAVRVCRLVEERDKMQKIAADLERKILSLQLGISEDKLAAYVEIVERAA